MDTAEEARDYDAMDHAEVNARFSEDFLAFARDAGVELATGARVLDVGTGTARIPLELLSRAPGLRITAIDLAEHMLAVARANVLAAGKTAHVSLEHVDAKNLPYEDGAFVATVSNSLVHHIPEPSAVLAEMWRTTAPGGLLFVRDLLRPEDEGEVSMLVARYAPEPRTADDAVREAFLRQRALFRASLVAALTTSDVAQMVAALGIAPSAVSRTSDRHWSLAARKP